MYQIINALNGYLAILLVTLNHSQAQPPPLDEHRTLRTESLWTYAIQEGTVVGAPHLSDRRQYDREGRILKSTTYGTDGSVSHEYHYRYGNSQRERYMKLPNGKEFVDQVEFYNAAEQLTARINYNANGDVENKLIQEYNSAGKKIKERFLENKDQVLQLVYAMQYDYYYLESGTSMRARYNHHAQGIRHEVAATLGKNDRMKLYQVYAAEGNLLKTIHFKHGDQGRLLSKQVLRGDDTLITACEYEYEESKMYTSIYESATRELVERVLHQYEYYQ